MSWLHKYYNEDNNEIVVESYEDLNKAVEAALVLHEDLSTYSEQDKQMVIDYLSHLVRDGGLELFKGEKNNFSRITNENEDIYYYFDMDDVWQIFDKYDP